MIHVGLYVRLDEPLPPLGRTRAEPSKISQLLRSRQSSTRPLLLLHWMAISYRSSMKWIGLRGRCYIAVRYSAKSSHYMIANLAFPNQSCYTLASSTNSTRSTSLSTSTNI